MIPKRFWKKFSKKYCVQCKVVCAKSNRSHKGHNFKDEFSIERVVRNIDEENMKNDRDHKVFKPTTIV